MVAEPRSPLHRQGSGHSLVEVLVSLTAFIALLVGVLFIFNLNYRLARGRSDTAQSQEALRSARRDIDRLVRMADQGGLPRDLAVEIRGDVAADARIGGPDSPRVMPGSDVLTVRGVFSTPLYRVGPADGSLRLEAAGTPATGVLEIRDPSPQTGVAQSLAELAATLEAGAPPTAALLMASQVDESIFAVVECDIESSSIGLDGDRINRIGLHFEAVEPTALLAGSGPAAALRGAAFVGLLEEYRFYVRAAHSVPGDDSSTPRLQLSVARFVPGTDQAWGDDASLAIDLADAVSDLQVSFGVDADGNRRLEVDLEG